MTLTTTYHDWPTMTVYERLAWLRLAQPDEIVYQYPGKWTAYYGWWLMRWDDVC